MTRTEYIEAVKVKLDELSAFEEPEDYSSESDSEAVNVKPIMKTIDETLDEAAMNCLRALPLSLLHADIAKQKSTDSSTSGVIKMSIDNKGVGRFNLIPTLRLVRYRHPLLKRDITAFITSEDALYLLQQSEYTRGGTAKPVAVWSSDENQMEIYSFPKDNYSTIDDTQSILLGLDVTKSVLSILSPIEDFIVLECAALVADILGNANAATVCRNEQTAKIQSILV